MNPTLKPLLAAVALALTGPAIGANNCDAIRAHIDAKFRAGGITRFTLATVDTGASVNGRVVGSCDLGTKKIVYLPSDFAAGGSEGGRGASRAPGGAPSQRADPDRMPGRLGVGRRRLQEVI